MPKFKDGAEETTINNFYKMTGNFKYALIIIQYLKSKMFE